MRIPRIYCAINLAAALQQNKPVSLDARCHHYLMHVLRKKTGESLTLFDGSGRDYKAQIVNIDRKKIDVLVNAIDTTETVTESPLTSRLVIGISKGDRMDFALQKAVELGVSYIQPLITERVNSHRGGQRLEKKHEHWSNTVVSACEQSGRSLVPEVAEPMPIFDWLSKDKKQSDPAVSELKLLLALSGTSLGQLLRQQQPIDVATVLIGPEGGLSDTEIQCAIRNGFSNVSLGTRVLRTETAPIVALSLLQHRWGDLG